MKKTILARLLTGLTASLLFAAGASAQTHLATVTNTSVGDPPGFTVSGSDLLETAFSAANTSPLDDAPGGGDTAYLQGLTPSGEASLRDGVWFSNTQSRGSAMVQNDEFAEFELDLVASPSGYTITGVDLYSNWGTGDGRNEIRVNVSCSLIGTPTVFDQTLVATGNDPLFVYNPSPGQTQGKMSLTGFNLAGVAAIRFDWPSPQENSGVGYSELDVFGTSTAGDIDPPTLSSSTPANGAIDVSTVDNLVFTFNEDVQAGAAGIIDLRTVTPDASVEAFDVTSSTQLLFDGRDLIIDPTSPLTPGEEYYLVIPIGAVDDTSTNDFVGILAPPDPSAFTFTTDNTPPSLTGAEILLNRLPGSDLTIKFDEAVALGTGTITIHLASDNSIVETITIPADASVDDDTVVVDIADLAFGTSYYLNVSAGAITDPSGNAFPAISDPSTITFSTVSNTPNILIHHWEFEGNPIDSIGNHDGTLRGSTGFAEGQIGQALNASIAGHGANMTTSSLPSSDFTASCWVNPSDVTATRHILGTRVGSTAGTQLKIQGGGIPTVHLQSGSNVVLGAPSALVADEWAHLAFTVDSTNGLTLYVNGSPVATDPLGTGHTVTDNFSVGIRSDILGENYLGLIDEMKIYAEVLSPAEIAALAAPPSEVITLQVTPSGGNLDFSWNSKSGMQYDLVSASDLLTDPSTWSVYNDGVTTHENIPSAGATTPLNGVIKVGPTRYFAVIGEEIPPLLSADFESGGIPAGWVAADNGSGTAWAVGAPVTGPLTAANGTNCAGSNLGDYLPNANATLTSPAFAAPAGGATLSFEQFIDTEAETGGPDFGSVRILDADNADTEIVDGSFPVTPIEGFTAGWSTESFALPAAALGKNIKIQFQFVSDGATEWAGFYVDDILVSP